MGIVMIRSISFIVPTDFIFFQTKYLMIINEATEMVNPNLSIKFAVGISLFANALLSLGTERHFKYYNDVWSGKVIIFYYIIYFLVFPFYFEVIMNQSPYFKEPLVKKKNLYKNSSKKSLTVLIY